MDHIGRAGVLRYAVCRGRVAHRNARADAVVERLHVAPLPAGRPARFEDRRRIGLEQHAVEHAVPADADALIRERGLAELIGNAERLEGDLRVLPGDVEDRQVIAFGRQPGRAVRAPDGGCREPTRFDDENPLPAGAGQLQLGRDDRPGGPGAHDDRIVAPARLVDGVPAPDEPAELRSDADRQTRAACVPEEPPAADSSHVRALFPATAPLGTRPCARPASSGIARRRKKAKPRQSTSAVRPHAGADEAARERSRSPASIPMAALPR